MFSILQKSQETVNAEDLETLQNEIERCLVDVVTQKWELEREFADLSEASPDVPQRALNSSIPHAPPSQPGGKLSNSLRADTTENSSDEFKGFSIGPYLNANECNVDAADSSEDGGSSSEDSSASNLTNSTTNTTATRPDNTGSQTQSTSSNISTAGGTKRSHKNNSDRPSKRFRQNSSNPTPTTGIGYPKRPLLCKQQRTKILPSKFRDSYHEESRPDKKQVLKNEAPDKLWPFVEQFCATPTDEQIRELEEMIKAIDDDKDYFKVPSLGRKNSPTKDSPDKNDGITKSPRKGSKSKNSDRDEATGLGALTQRLVSSFIEETEDSSNDISKSNEASPCSKKKVTKNKNNNNNSNNNKSVDLNNARNLEKRIRQELEEYAILNRQDDIPYTSEEDEILRELVTSQHELLTIQRQNKASMQILLKKAKRHKELQMEREKLKEANADVIAAYHKLIQAKQRKRNPTKKEKDAAWKASKVQEAIFKRCDDLYMSSLDRNSG